MPKAIVVAVGDTPLNPLNDLLKQNSISSNVIDASTSSVDEIDKLIQADDQGQCVLLKGVSSLSQHIPRIADATEKLVLLYCSPATALANALETSNGTVKPEQVINRWQESVSQAMAMVEESELYSLCDLNDVLEHSSLFLKDFFAINKAAAFKPSTYTKKQLANHLATLYLFEQDDAFALYDEALSIGKLFGEFTVHLGPEVEDLKSKAEAVGKSVLETLTVNYREIQAKAARIQELQQQLNDTETKQGDVQASLEKIKSEKNDVERALNQMSETHKERVKELESHLESLKNTKQAFEENISELNDQLGQSKTLNKQQAEKLESLQQQLNSTNTKLKEATENKEQIVAEYDKRIEQAQQHSANLEKEQQEIVKELNEFKQLLQAEKQDKKELEKTLEATKQAKQQKDQELNKQADVVAEQNNQVAALKKKSAELQQVQENLQQQLESTNTKLKEATENKAQMVAEYDKRIAQAQQHSANLEKEQQEIVKELEEYKQLLQAEKQAKKELEKILEATKQASHEKDERLNKQTDVLAEQNHQVTALKKKIAELQQTKENLLAEKEQLVAAKDQQQSEITACVEENRRIVAERKAVTQQLEQANSDNKQAVQNKKAIEEQYQSASEKLEEANKRLAELEQLPAKLESVTQQYELAELQIAQLQEELESTVSQIDVLSPLPERLKESQAMVQEYSEKIEQLTSDKSLAEIQIAQLQEELESTVSQIDVLSPLPERLNESQAKVQDYAEKIEQLTSDKSLAEMQVAQLQEELEATLVELTKQQTLTKQLTEQTKSSEGLITDYNQLQSEKDAAESEIVRLQTESVQLAKQNSELESKCKSLTQQVDAATQSHSKKSQALIGELQSQLAQQIKRNEQIEELKDKLENQLKESEAGMTKNKEYHQTELELASIQISQLQEELEYYYQAYQEAQNKGESVKTMANQRQKVFSKAMAAGIKVIGKYADDGYQDIHFVLSDVRLGCGKEFAELPVKLANVGGHIAVEFRDTSEGNLFQHFDDTTDEYGPFLRFYANPPAEQTEQQKLVFNRMNASERVLVMSTIMLIAELLQNQSIECEVQIDASEWRSWRLAAIELLEATESVPAWLSFDSVVLKEEFRTSGYEHLWLEFKNVLVGDNWQERLELKVAASNVTGDEQPFSNEIALEFRALEDGTPPLLSWPPETADEYGHKLIVQLGVLNSLSDLATPDLNLITHLANNLSSIIEKAEVQHAEMQRPKKDWISAIELLSQEQQPEVNADKPVIPKALFSVNEVVSMGSYQHVLFSKSNDNTKLKLKALNINPDTFDAELFVEIRNGGPDVIYHDTEFFGEDEYGPRVLIPAEALMGEITNERRAEFSWLVEAYDQICTELESSSEVDELVKRLWVNMLNRKQSIL
jgi:DNA repair exonuclease SbcCD ATPase subunit